MGIQLCICFPVGGRTPERCTKRAGDGTLRHQFLLHCVSKLLMLVLCTVLKGAGSLLSTRAKLAGMLSLSEPIYQESERFQNLGVSRQFQILGAYRLTCKSERSMASLSESLPVRRYISRMIWAEMCPWSPWLSCIGSPSDP